MDWDEFAKWGARISDDARDYHKTLRARPVRAQTQPGEVFNALPDIAPEAGTDMEEIYTDYQNIVLPGMTHWQHPGFFAYFPSNATPPSMLAEFLSTTLGAQCMLWQTSPAATEMETKMMHWLRQSLGLGGHFEGVIQDSASSATLVAVLIMRERALNWAGNKQGLSGLPKLRIYCSPEVHTSIDRAIWVAGIGQDNLVRIPITDDKRGMDPEALRAAIAADIAAGHTPAGVIISVGGTGTGATDPVDKICDVAEEFDLYTHVDAAWAGSAMICPEYRTLWPGVDRANSIVFNPHKWLGVQFDCSVQFFKSPDELVRTLAIKPEYLKTHGKDGVINYSEWSVPLGRRFRALKIWFVLRVYGLEGLRKMIRNHVTWSQELCERIRAVPDFEIVTEPVLSLFTFRYAPIDCGELDALNQRLVDAINDDGRIYLTQTLVDTALVLRFQAGQFHTTKDDVLGALDVITQTVAKLNKG